MTPDGFTVHTFDTVDSTQNLALERLRAALSSTQNTPPPSVQGTVIQANIQTNGRGRQGRHWENQRGNLVATLIWPVKPGHPPGDYSLITAVSLVDAVQSFLSNPSDLKIKWPNDLLIKGDKVSGILIEQPEPGWLLIGTGVNILFAPENRARLIDFCQNPPDYYDVLTLFLKKFQDWTGVYNRDGLIPICQSWIDRAYGIGSDMTVRLPRENFQAIFKGLDLTDGACVVELPNGTIRRVHSGEVFFDQKP